jgi:hypothetical protein
MSRGSSFLRWLEGSSGGVFTEREMTHYAIFTDDTCMEVLSIDAPLVKGDREVTAICSRNDNANPPR